MIIIIIIVYCINCSMGASVKIQFDIISIEVTIVTDISGVYVYRMISAMYGDALFCVVWLKYARYSVTHKYLLLF